MKQKLTIIALLFTFAASAQRTLVNIVAGEDLNIFQAVYVNGSDGKAYRADPSNPIKTAQGLITSTVLANADAQMQMDGAVDISDSGISVTGGDMLYVNNSSIGNLTTTRNTTFQQIAIALSDTTLLLNISPVVTATTGTVTTVSVTTANGVSGSVSNASTTPAISLTLGAITPTSVNGVTLSGSSTPTLAVTGTTAVSGTNTGDQNIPTWVLLGSDATTTSTTLANVSGMSFTATANKTYIVELMGTFQTVATTTGIGLGFDIPSGTVTGIIFNELAAQTNTSNAQNADAATVSATSGARATTTNIPVIGRWIIAVGGSGGTVQLMIKSEVASSGITLLKDITAMSYIRIN